MPRTRQLVLSAAVVALGAAIVTGATLAPSEINSCPCLCARHCRRFPGSAQGRRGRNQSVARIYRHREQQHAAGRVYAAGLFQDVGQPRSV